MKHLLILLFSIYSFISSAQTNPPGDWYLKDIDDTAAAGINIYKAYEFLKGKSPEKEIIVAVIDGGTDIEHTEFANGNIWINPKEIAGNNFDDDKNGLIDDINGWNYIGGKLEDVRKDNLEYVRVVARGDIKFLGKEINQIAKSDLKEYETYLTAKKLYETKYEEYKNDVDFYNKLYTGIDKIIDAIGKDTVLLEDLENYTTEDKELSYIKKVLISSYKRGDYPKTLMYDCLDAFTSAETNLNYRLNKNYNSRLIIGDNFDDFSESNYGNNRVKGPEPKHGTAVAGCIANIVDNEKFNAAGPKLKLMILRVVPDGDEREKDIANAVKYAVNNGASIINMSFGKGFSYRKETVDEAFKYAESKDVLLVHAAGNDGRFIDKEIHYPTNFYGDNQNEKIPNMITVGASTHNNTAARFSNYGKKSVDVFAPGAKIYTTFPDNKYNYISGTSFSCPITSGVAALIRCYYPKLTAVQVKNIISESAYRIKGKVELPGNPKKHVKFKKLCKTGGIIDARKAMELADKMSQVKTQ